MPELNAYIWIGLCAILVVLDVWAIISVFRSSKSVTTKSLWALAIAILPLVGLIYWAIAGPRGMGPGPSSAEHSKG